MKENKIEACDAKKEWGQNTSKRGVNNGSEKLI